MATRPRYVINFALHRDHGWSNEQVCFYIYAVSVDMGRVTLLVF